MRSLVRSPVAVPRKSIPPPPPTSSDSRQLIGDALRQRVDAVDPDCCDAGDEDTFFVADLGEVYRQHVRWKRALPRVKPFYAVKCNPDGQVLRLLAALGAGFDCASKAEVDLALGLVNDPSRVIYAQPCKTASYLRAVAAQGVRQMTFDNADELHKVARLCPQAELFLRIQTDDSAALCPLSLKFGAPLEDVDNLLSLAAQLGLNVVGVAFHVGSGASDPDAFRSAVRDAHLVFEKAAVHGFRLRCLDVGGGFSHDTFDAMADVLRETLDDHFPAHAGVALMAEPGRFFVATAFTLACHVIARRSVPAQRRHMVYVNDGVYGNFSSIMFDHQQPEPRLLQVAGQFLYDGALSRSLSEAVETESSSLLSTSATASTSTPSSLLSTPSSLSSTSTSSTSADASVSSVDSVSSVEYSIWGPTCDGIDRIAERVLFASSLPPLDVGDWLYFEDMGAYTRCSATRFNGFRDDHDVEYVCSEGGARALLL